MLKAYTEILVKSSDRWTNFEAWLWKVARTTAIDYFQDMRRFTRYDKECEKNDSMDYLGAFIKEERKKAVREATARLRGKKKEVIKLRWSGTLSFEKIAKKLHITRNNAYQLHKRALADLRRFLIKLSTPP